MGSEAIQTWDLVINYVDDDVSKGALWMDSMGDGKEFLEKGSLL